MTSQLVELCFDANDPSRLARFWADLLDRETDGRRTDRPAARGRRVRDPVPADGGAEDRPEPDPPAPDQRSAAHQRRRSPRALGLGGSHLDVGQPPEEEHVVLADPEGNELCVIEPGNAFLAGCGLLGELACDGHAGRRASSGARRSAGRSCGTRTRRRRSSRREGGAKIAWGGPPVRPKARAQPPCTSTSARPSTRRPSAPRSSASSRLGATRIGAGRGRRRGCPWPTPTATSSASSSRRLTGRVRVAAPSGRGSGVAGLWLGVAGRGRARPARPVECASDCARPTSPHG